MPPEAAPAEGQGAILMVSHYFEDHRGGIEIVAGRLADALGRMGFDVTWAATGETQAEGSWRTIPLHAWNGTERALGIPFPLLSPNAATLLSEACAKADAIIVHDALYPTSVAARLAGRRSRKPVMIVQHIGAVAYRNPLLRVMMRIANRLIARPMLRYANQAVFISETTRRHFDLPMRSDPATIFNGVDVDTFRPVSDVVEKRREREALGLPQDRPVALFVGRFVEKKGLHWLQRLAEAHPDILWAFAGWGPIDPESWALPNVALFRDLSGASLAGLYRAADIFVLPSIGEGFPLVVQEALASGLPVLCSDEVEQADPAAAHLLHGVALRPDAEQETVAALSRAVANLLADQGDPAARHDFAREHYSWANAASAYAVLIRAMIADARGEA